MNIAAKNSLGVFAECPHCHCAMQHGFQVCGSCGHTVTAEEQQALRNMLKRNVARHFLVFVALMGVGLVVAYRLFGV
jgi:methionyl-tRNA synthetase